MTFILEFYRRFTVRTRIVLLCTCYSFCIVVAVGAGRSLPTYLAIASTAIFVLLGIIFSVPHRFNAEYMYSKDLNEN